MGLSKLMLSFYIITFVIIIVVAVVITISVIIDIMFMIINFLEGAIELSST